MRNRSPVVEENRSGRRERPADPAGLVPLRGLWLERAVVVGLAIFLLWCCLPIVDGPRPSAQRASCLSNVRQIASALITYSDDYDGVFPSAFDWQTAVSGYVPSNAFLFHCPVRSDLNSAYAFNSGIGGAVQKKLRAPGSRPMVFESRLDLPNAADTLQSWVAPHQGQGVVAFADGRVKSMSSPPAP